MGDPETRNRILRAAEAVLVRTGTKSLTLEAVAREAEVSKGGLLYHFPSKKALIAGMVAGSVAEFDRLLAEGEARSGRWLETYVDQTLADLEAEDWFAGILAASAEDPQLLVPFREALDRWYRRAVEAYGPRVVPLLLALDGLWVHAKMGTLPSLDREVVKETLRTLAREVLP